MKVHVIIYFPNFPAWFAVMVMLMVLIGAVAGFFFFLLLFYFFLYSFYSSIILLYAPLIPIPFVLISHFWFGVGIVDTVAFYVALADAE